MAAIYGGKVKEPKVTRRSTLPVEKKATYAEDLAQAWTSFGEAKSVLQKLETITGSPPLKKQRRSKPYSVRFETQNTKMDDLSSIADHPCARGDMNQGTAGKENQYIIEPELLNRRDSSVESDSVSSGVGAEAVTSRHNGSSPPRRADVDGVGRRQSQMNPGTQDTNATFTSATTTQQYHQTSPVPRVPTSSAHLYTLSPSNPNNAGSPQRQHQPLHSNATAVFGPAVKFGDQTAGRKLPKVTSSISSAVTKHQYTTSASRFPHRATPTTSATTHVQSGGMGAGRYVPIRKFELPAETVGTLKAQIELQKQAVRASSAKVDSLNRGHGFYPLPEASTATSSFSSTGIDPHTHLRPHPPPTHASLSDDYLAGGAVKKRKVASAPPPQSYVGFSSTKPSSLRHTSVASRDASTNPVHGPAQWQPNLEKVGKGTASSATRTMSTKAQNVTGSTTSAQQQQQHPGGRVRKVHRFSPDVELPTRSAPLHSTQTTRVKDWGSKTRQLRSPSPADSQSSLGLSSSHSAISNVSSSLSLPADGDQHFTNTAEKHLKRGTTNREREDRVKSVDSEKKPGLSVDVAKLLEDLETSGAADEDENGGQESHPQRSKRHVSGSGGGAGGATAATKKPRYNFEPVYPTEKIRHYDQAEVKSYIQRKQEERRRKAHEDRLSQERASKERQDKLRKLYDTQRKKVETNLRLKQQRREAYSRSLASSVHIHLHCTASSSSEALDDSIPGLAVNPASPRLHSQVTAGTYRTSRSTPPPTSHTLYPSPPSYPPKYMSPSHRLSPHASPHAHTLVHESPPSHIFHPSPPRYPPPPHTSPLRYNTLGDSNTPTRAYSSPTRTSYHHEHPHSPPQLQPTLSTYSPSQYVHVPTSTIQTKQGFDTVTHSSIAGSTTPGKLTTLLRGADPSTEVSNALKSREDRIKALTQSALKLKDRIATETRRLEEGLQPHQDVSVQHSSTSTAAIRPPYQHQASQMVHGHGGDLPGVRNIREHALQAERLQCESQAATKIQAAYRGYSLRKSLQWGLPSGRSLGSALRGVEVKVEEIESDGTLTPVEDTPVVVSTSKGATPIVSKASHHPVPLFQPASQYGTPPPTTRMEPWTQTGGDSHSVINIFTRQHERLKETLNQLSDQKRAEIRRLGEDGSLMPSIPPQHSAAHSGLSHQGSPASTAAGTYTYTESFESTSSKPNAMEEESMDDGSQVSSQFSRDSLSERTLTISERFTLKSDTTRATQHTATQTSTHAPSDSAEEEVHAITPPGSPSFVNSFTSPHQSATHTRTSDPPKQTYEPPPPPPAAASSTLPSGRLSPRSLELKLQAELNLLDTTEESMRQLSHIENTRAVSLAQQETVTLAQLLKSRQQNHEREMESLSSRAQQDVERAQKQLESEAALTSKKMKDLQQEMDAKMKEQSAQIRQESAQATQEATKLMRDAQMAATTAMMESAQQQLQAAQTMAVSVASTAAQVAIKAAFRERDEMKSPRDKSTVSETAPNYESDFEPSTIQPDSLAESETDGSYHPSKPPPSTSTESRASSSPIEESLTPTTTEGKEGDDTLVAEDESYRSSSPQEELEDDISEVSFRELLPSESHRRQQISRHKQSRGNSESDDTRSLLGDVSRSNTPTLGEQSPFSPGGEDSFFQFMSHMVQSYMHEEELRSRHQQALLQLREKALEEKTKAELDWIKLKKRHLQSKGADDQMPPLVKREKGLLRKLHHEQSEIRKLKEAQQAASHERKLMLHQQKEITKMRRSTQYYRDKIHKYRQKAHPSRTPSPFPSLDETIVSQVVDESGSEHSIAEELSDMEHDSSAPPSEHLEHSLPVEQESYSISFPTYTPSEQVTTQPVTVSESHALEVSEIKSPSMSTPVRVKETPSERTTDLPRTPTSEKVTLKKLRKFTAADTERYHAKREQSLLKRRQAAEEALKYHEELLKKEQQLDQEEQEVNRLVTKAVECISQHPKPPSKREKKIDEDLKLTSPQQQAESLSIERSPPAGMKPATASVSEHISVSASVMEEIPEEDVTTSKGDQSTVIQTEQSPSAKVPSEYEGDTFESLDTTLTYPHHPPITTSTPDRPSQELSQRIQFDDISLSDSLKITSSIDSVTTTSEASVIEARIRLLKEQLRQRKEEVKRVQSEQKQKKKALLKQQEEQLKRKLEAIENRAKRVLMSPPPRSTTSSSISAASSITSRTQSERSESDMSAREQSMSPLMVSHPPFLQLTGDVDLKGMGDKTKKQLQIVSQGSSVEVEEDLSPVTSPTYTPFTDSLRVSGSLKDETQVKVKLEEKQLPMETLDSPVAEDVTPRDHQQTQSVSEDTIVTEEEDKALSVQETHVAEETHERQTIEPTKDKVDSSDSSIVSSIAEQLSEQLEDGSAMDEPKPSEEEKEPQYTESFEEPTSSVHKPSLKKPSTAELQQETAEMSTHTSKTDLVLPTESTDSLPISLSGSHGGESDEQGNYCIGQRVLVGNVMAGTIKFIGDTHFAPGLWIGVEIDLPKGRNDGSIDDQRYFVCKPKHGVFAPPNKVSPLVDKEHLSEEEDDESSVAEEIDSEHESGEEDKEESEVQPSSRDEQSHSVSPKPEEYSADFVSSSEESQGEPSTQVIKEQQYYEHLGDSPAISHPSKTDKQHTDSITEDLEGSVSEQPAPASEMFNNLGEKPESMPLAPEVMNQRSQSATPTPAPPPEFAEGASRESSIEPPFTVEEDVQSTYRLSTELITDELAQELTNEAFETMHKIWKAKHAVQSKRPQVSQVTESPKKPAAEVVVVSKYKDVALTLDDKADRITDQLMALLLQSESTVMYNIHSCKKPAEDKQLPTHQKDETQVKAPRPRPPPLEDFQTKATSPTKRTPPGQLILSPSGFVVESSPPPLSPPSPYRLSPPPLGMAVTTEYSPPGSPPRHLSQATAARVAAGEKTPYLSGAHHDGTPVGAAQKKPPVLERSASIESISQLLDSIKLTTAQCMVPSDRESVNEVVEHAWNVAKSINPDALLSSPVCCPNEVLELFKNVRELSPEEEHCRVAYLKLVFNLSVAIIKSMHPVEETLPVWLKECSVNTQLAQKHKNNAELSLETVQNKVYAALIRGQLPAQLPSVKFLYGMKRPGGREIDFVDTVLIKELREEEPSWVNYTEDETSVKMRTADSILDSLISETVEILSHIKHKRQMV